MPRYVYHCETCNATYERQVPIAESGEQFCRDCGEQLEMLPSRPASFPVGKYGKGTR